MRVSGVLASLVTVASASSRLDVIDLPMGFFPEGITSGGGWTAFVGSLVGEFHVVGVLAVLISFPIGFSFLTTCGLENRNLKVDREECGLGVLPIRRGVPVAYFSIQPRTTSGHLRTSAQRMNFSRLVYFAICQIGLGRVDVFPKISCAVKLPSRMHADFRKT